MPVDPNQKDKILAHIQKEYGPESFRTGGEIPTVDRLSTGSLALDWATGGGIPIGRWSHFYGPFSSGKSLITWMTIKAAQQLGQESVYYNIEKQFDPIYVKSLGVDLDRLLVVEGTKMEELGDKLQSLLAAYHLHAIDSLGAAISTDELNADPEGWTRAIAPRVWSKVFRRAGEFFDTNENTVIMVNQIRARMDYMGGVSPTGGKFIEHRTDLALSFFRGKKLYRRPDGALVEEGDDKGPSGKPDPDGFEIVIHVDKNKVGVPGRSVRLRYDYSLPGLDILHEYVVFGLWLGLIERKGAWYSCLGEEKSVQGEKAVRERLDGDKDLKSAIEAAAKEQW